MVEDPDDDLGFGDRRSEQSTFAEGAQLPDHETRQWGPGAVLFDALEESKQMGTDDLVEDGLLGLVAGSLPWHPCWWRGRCLRLPVRLRVAFCERGVPGPGRRVLKTRICERRIPKPRGIGYPIDLCDHDKQAVGDQVHSAAGRKRSRPFGDGYRRLDRDLAHGMVVTVRARQK